MLGQVAVAFEIGQHPHDSEQFESFVAAPSRVEQCRLDGHGGLGDELIDPLVGRHEGLGRFTVAGEQGVAGAGDGL